MTVVPSSPVKLPTRKDLHRAMQPNIVAPFILSPESITLRQIHSPTHFDAVWLRTPVTARATTSRRNAIEIFHSMYALRHPNLENILGVVLDARTKRNIIITEQVPRHTISHFIASSHHRGMDVSKGCQQHLQSDDIITMAMHVARVLVYLNATTKTGHPSGLCSHKIVYDPKRARAVLLLTTTCDYRCNGFAHIQSLDRDVAMLAKITSKLFSTSNRKPPKVLQKILAHCASSDVAKRPSCEEFSRQLIACHASLS